MIEQLIDLGFMLCILFGAFGAAALVNGILQYLFNLTDRWYEAIERGWDE